MNATSPYSLTAALGSVSTNVAYNGIATTFGDFPSTFSKTDTLRFNAKYTIDKTSSLRFNYAYQKLSSADPLFYNGLQMGAANNAVAGSGTASVNGTSVPAGSIIPISSLMPTNEQAPNYKVQAVGVTYIYSFQ
jgi:hypothetical protein